MVFKNLRAPALDHGRYSQTVKRILLSCDIAGHSARPLSASCSNPWRGVNGAFGSEVLSADHMGVWAALFLFKIVSLVNVLVEGRLTRVFC